MGGNLIKWSSKKQHVVARSSCEAEYRALSQAAAEVLWLSSLFAELGIRLPHCPILWCDNQGAGSLAQNPVFHARTKHIEIDVHFVREKIASGLLKVQYVPTEHQCADILTKALPSSRFAYLRSKLNLDVSPTFSLRGNVRDKAQVNLCSSQVNDYRANTPNSSYATTLAYLA